MMGLITLLMTTPRTNNLPFMASLKQGKKKHAKRSTKQFPREGEKNLPREMFISVTCKKEKISHGRSLCPAAAAAAAAQRDPRMAQRKRKRRRSPRARARARARPTVRSLMYREAYTAKRERKKRETERRHRLRREKKSRVTAHLTCLRDIQRVKYPKKIRGNIPGKTCWNTMRGPAKTRSRVTHSASCHWPCGSTGGASSPRARPPRRERGAALPQGQRVNRQCKQGAGQRGERLLLLLPRERAKLESQVNDHARH